MKALGILSRIRDTRTNCLWGNHWTPLSYTKDTILRFLLLIKREGKDQAYRPIPSIFLTRNSPADPLEQFAHRYFLRGLEQACVPALQPSQGWLCPAPRGDQSLARCQASPSPGQSWGTYFPVGKWKPAFGWWKTWEHPPACPLPPSPQPQYPSLQAGDSPRNPHWGLLTACMWTRKPVCSGVSNKYFLNIYKPNPIFFTY